MKEFLNFSVYECDIQKFGSSWENLEYMLKRQNLDGLELLVNFEPPSREIPAEIVGAVHLPYFMGWYRIWTDERYRIPADIPEEFVKFFYGGWNRDEIVSNFCRSLSSAAGFSPAYGVFHAAHVEINDFFSTQRKFSDLEVLRANAEMLNEAVSAFPGGEPPFEIYIENLWHPGLTYMDQDAVMDFMEMLEFNRWKLLLDTGHLMNAAGSCNEENGAIDRVMECLYALDDEIIRRIDGIHLHLSTSGDYAGNIREPENFRELKFDEKYLIILEHLKKIDQHRPFTSQRCRDIVDFINPAYLTHELPAPTAEEIERMVSMQTRALRGKI